MDEPAVRPNVLIVDDTVENLHLLSKMLSDHGYEGRPVTSGRQAFLAAKSAPPELVLLDVMMPEMDGYEVCRRLKAVDELREIPVIFLTALTDTTDKLKAFEAGGADYVTKPFQIDEVLARVRVHIDLARSRRQLSESFERLRALERVREDLVQMVVHDMRSPLSALIMLLQCMQHDGGALGGQLEEDLKSAIQSATSVNRMANDVLDVSRLEEGKLPLDRKRHDVVAIGQEVANRLATLDPTRTIGLDAAASIEIDCDRTIVSRVLENIVINALKYSPTGGRITLAASRHGEWVRVSVRDEGRGVPPEARAKIFEKFGMVEARQDQSFHSAGLGLAFCKLAVEAHGGTIGVEPAEPKGSIFWFELPA